MARKMKDRYKKGDKVAYQIDYGASPMLAKSKAEKSKAKVGYVSKVKKDAITKKPTYLINNITIPHVNVLGLAEAIKPIPRYKSGRAIIKKGMKIKMMAASEMKKFALHPDYMKYNLKAAGKTFVIKRVIKSRSGDSIEVEGYPLYRGESGFDEIMIKSLVENKQQGENTMKITRKELVELIKEVLQEETEYQKYFKEKLSGKSLGSMSDEEKKAFFADVEKGWKAKGESGGEVEETLEPVSQAAGEPKYNPTQSLSAKKRNQILAQEKVENYVRKLVREELKFVMFNEVPGTISRKRAKKRIAQTGSAEKSL
jgi:hypothetical protein